LLFHSSSSSLLYFLLCCSSPLDCYSPHVSALCGISHPHSWLVLLWLSTQTGILDIGEFICILHAHCHHCVTWSSWPWVGCCHMTVTHYSPYCCWHAHHQHYPFLFNIQVSISYSKSLFFLKIDVLDDYFLF